MKNSEIILSLAWAASVFLSACGRPEEKTRQPNPPEKAAASAPEEAGENSSGKGFVPPNKLVPFKSFSEKSPGAQQEVLQSTAQAPAAAGGTSVITNITNNPDVKPATAAVQAPVDIPVKKRAVYPH